MAGEQDSDAAHVKATQVRLLTQLCQGCVGPVLRCLRLFTFGRPTQDALQRPNSTPPLRNRQRQHTTLTHTACIPPVPACNEELIALVVRPRFSYSFSASHPPRRHGLPRELGMPHTTRRIPRLAGPIAANFHHRRGLPVSSLPASSPHCLLLPSGAVFKN